MATTDEAGGDLITETLLSLIRGLFRTVRWLIRRPALLVLLVLVGLAMSWRGWDGAAVTVGLVVLLLVGFRLVAPRAFARSVSGPWRRAKVRRRYRKRWPMVADMCGITVSRGGSVVAPRLGRIDVGGHADRLEVRLVVGQTAMDYERACPKVAEAFGARSARVEQQLPGILVVVLLRVDPLTGGKPLYPIAESPDLRCLPIGVREDGTPWTVALLGSHLFIGGATGSGKGSVLWGLLRAVGAPIHSGLLQVWAADPKGGMELGFGRPLFTRFGASTEAIVSMLEDAVQVMDARCARLAGLVRAHQPTKEEPMIVVVIDELSTLTAYEPDTKLRSRATAATSGLLARGRAAAVVVVAAAQDPRKEVVSFRSLFPAKVALRLDTPSQVDMVLGDGMHGMGAAADRIPASTPGVGYVCVEGVREPVRVRAAWVSDDDILALAATYPAPISGKIATGVDSLDGPAAGAA